MVMFRRQGYHFVGTQAAVKTCLWLRKSLRDEGACYKSRFYGISSHRCIQMTPTLTCNHACLHCWRPTGVSIPAKWDEPKSIVEGCLREQKRLISGYAGSRKTNIEKLKDAKKPKHAAISLDGEPTLYPMLGELIDEFHRMGMTTFVVTNGSRPDVTAEIKPTQLYISVNAPDEETFTKMCSPQKNEWQRLNESLETMKNLDTRTCLRITLVKDLNIKNADDYAKLIKKAEPDFVEVKAYMHLGYSRMRLPRSAMPSHSVVREFAEEVGEACGYEIRDEVEISRVVLLSPASCHYNEKCKM